MRNGHGVVVAAAVGAVLLGSSAVPAAAGQGVTAGSYDGGSCGRLDTEVRPAANLKLKVGKPKSYSISFVSERPCTLGVFLRPMGRESDDGGLVVSPSMRYVPVTTPGTATWVITGTRKDDGLLVAAVQGGGRNFGIRLNDVTVR
ncbi:MAG: hypothetical protein ACT4QF_20775 [Sporichthyaceae bacterium]